MRRTRAIGINREAAAWLCTGFENAVLTGSGSGWNGLFRRRADDFSQRLDRLIELCITQIGRRSEPQALASVVRPHSA